LTSPTDGPSYSLARLFTGKSNRSVVFVILAVLAILGAGVWSAIHENDDRAGPVIPTKYGSPVPPERPAPAASPERSIAPNDYTILNVKDVSMWTLEKESKPERKRFEISITAPAAKTFEDRGRTIVSACRVLQREYGAHVVQVWLEPNDNTRGLGFVLAMATYSPDGKGMSGTESGVVWDNVSSTDYQPNAKALKMTKDSRLGDISMEQARVITSRRPYAAR
jgi:hypothetical protein